MNSLIGQEDKYKIINGNSVNKLKELPDNSVDTIITSPPYYALRDYGTGKWVGGDANCPHYRTSKYSPNNITGQTKQFENTGLGQCDAIYKSVCPLCGAVRVDEQIGLEETPEEYIQKLVDVFHEAKRVLKDEGTLWVNIGDSYWGSGSRGFDFTEKFSEKSEIQKGSKGTTDLHNIPKLVGESNGVKNKDLIGIPWMLAFALRADGWYLRQDIIWAKPNCMPESVHDRCTKSHEYIFLFSKKPHYYFDADSIKTPLTDVTANRIKYGWNCDSPSDGDKGIHTEEMGNRFAHENGANKRDVWSVSVGGGYTDENGSHYATYPEDLIKPCILAGSKVGGVILDPFSGSGTTGAVAIKLNRKYVGIELNENYMRMSISRLDKIANQYSLFD